MLTHSEAQALISASLDWPLDPDIEDVLAEHLATCDECRLFAASSQRLASALASWPTIPESPAVRQGVWNAIESPAPWWQQIGAALGGRTAAVASTAAIAILIIALATLAIVRLNDDGGDDEGARLAAGTSQALALATETAAPTQSPPPAETSTATATAAPTSTPASASTIAATEPSPAPTPTAPADTPVDLTGGTTPPGETPADLTATQEPAPSPTQAAQAAFIPVTETPVPPTPTPEPTNTPEPTETPVPPTSTPEPTSTPSPTPEPAPANFTVTLLDQGGSPVPNACWALIRDDETVVESCDTPEVETAEFASNGNSGFFDIPSGSYTLRMTSGPDGVTVPDRKVEIAPGSSDIETITATVATPTPAPTNTPEPTSTPEPTATPAPPTSTPEPTATPSPEPEPTSTPEPTQEVERVITEVGTPGETPVQEETSPPIEPVDGQVIDSGAAGSATEPPPPGSTAAVPRQDVVSPAEATQAAGGATVATDAQVIEPVGGDTTPAPTAQADTGDGTGATAPPESDGFDLVEAPIAYEPWDDINLRLTFENDAIVLTSAPGGVSLEGPTVQQQAGDGSTYLAVCDGECVPATEGSAEGDVVDSPIGWVNGQLIYQRQTASGEVELRSLNWVGEPAGDTRIGSAPTTLTPYADGYLGVNGILIPCAEGWLLVGDGQASVIDGNPYGEPQLVRTSFSAPLIAYVSGGQLIIADQSSPGTAISSIPFSGDDYDLSPDTERVVISTGQGLEIRSREGALLGASGSGIATGSVVWLGDGIYVIDLTNGAIRLVQPDSLT